MRTVGVLVAIATISVLSDGRAQAQLFSNREGYYSDGTYQVHVEITPYLWLPATDASIGLKRAPNREIDINRPSPTVADLVSSLSGAFVADTLVRYGPWSAEVNFDWIAVHKDKTLPPFGPAPEGKLKLYDSSVYVAPGIGYQIIPAFAPDKLSFDVRAGFSYFQTNASASITGSLLDGAHVSYDFVQPWVGFRANYYPSPHWRIDLRAAATGLGVDGGVWGWNALLGASYLITRWLDVTLAYAALAADRHGKTGLDGSSRKLSLTSYGPLLAVGFRF